MKVTPRDFLDYYSCMWNTLTVVAPKLGVTLRYDNSDLCRRFPDFREREQFLCSAIEQAAAR